MKRYFINPELKRSSALLVGIITVFLLISCTALKLQRDRMKQEYIKDIGGMAARIVQQQPDLEAAMMPVLTGKLSAAEKAKGVQLLSKYGITGNLEDSLFPYLNQTWRKENWLVCGAFAVVFGLLFLLNYVQHRFFYSRIRNLTAAAKKVVDGDYEVVIDEDREGDLSKLANSFNSMRGVIRNNLYTLRQDKQFLVDILSDISHQLKTPLSSLILYNDILLTSELSPEQRHTFLVNNQNQLNRMNWLIRNILKLAKLDARAVELSLEKQSMNETIHDALEALSGKALEKQVELVFQDTGEVLFVHDRYWFEEALINIIKNGIEHTDAGGQIQINLQENPIYWRITIEDNGEGIAVDDLPHIFKRFYKTKSSKKNDSVGIGLALSKAIIELHNGRIEVYSKLGEGTKFTVTINKY